MHNDKIRVLGQQQDGSPVSAEQQQQQARHDTYVRLMLQDKDSVCPLNPNSEAVAILGAD